ncbi:hypothetical protein [Rhodovulum euryhalinum]|uniref:Uncharacterized protein n=1 Tax=Rhodovulum euryhalinum TaxID=35805 RepID=A0A4V2SAD6_9RHOB|nr:hypothetical protein [Rhodovulum euryhalinum]TCO71160.1 hypothetical protein EV655_10752 [Rhodovulum euryhalinum]
MRRAAALLLMALAGCAAPSGQVAVTPDGEATGALSTGPVTVAGGPGGAAASVRVVDTAHTDLIVGTDGAAVAVRPGGLPVRLGLGTGGISLGF